MHSFLSEEHDDIAYLELKGSIKSSDIDAIRFELEKLFEAKRPFFIIDISKVESLAGAVLGEILEWRVRLHETIKGDIALTGATPLVDRELHEFGVDKMLKLFEDNESAVNYLYWEYKGLTENILFTIPNQLAVVPAIRNFVKKCVLAKEYSTREAFQIETIVDELCNNAIEHGQHGVEGVVEVALSIGRDKIEINIANGIEFINGENSSPEAITRVMNTFRDTPSSTIDNPRGRGLALVKMLASEFDIDSSDDGTCVHVIKYREA